ncbi:metallophosphoesterase [Brevibacillus sp. VP]|uniref:metallophosphoesterase n=1 Tax=unclassified Brevibacillus TaxID=2684853 RepID=UPI001F276F90|nr:metallophosphoesterase [Brevibacillus sp. VP]
MNTDMKMNTSNNANICMTTKLHTIFLLVGPSECGKTTFAKHILIPQLQRQDESKNYRANVQYISSDEIRQEILGAPYHKYDQRMLESSKQAFDVLFSKLQAVTSFPIQVEFVIVDTIGLSEEFREQVATIAREQHYHVEIILFDYKNVQEYYNTTDLNRSVIANHVKRLRQEVLGSLSKLKANAIHRIRTKDFIVPSTGEANPKYVVQIGNDKEYLTHLLPQEYRYLVVGDVHEQVHALKELLAANGFSLNENKIFATDKTSHWRIVLLGDWIDKGGNTREIVEFILENRNWFYLIKGNHENFVYKLLRGDIKQKEIEPSLLEKYFTSAADLSDDEQLCSMFFQLVEQSKDFYRFIGSRSASFFLTHAPCKNKYIGKLDAYAKKRQRNFYVDRDRDIEQQLDFLQAESASNHPYHVFGHVASQSYYRLKNKIGLDSGAGHGHALSSVWLDRNRPICKQSKMDDRLLLKEALPHLFQSSHSDVQLDSLEEWDKRRIEYVLEHKINYISGTMAPADKDIQQNELESLQKGLSYFRKHGVEQVVLQPKYMGSRCNIYLHQDIEQCFAVSRNGYKIKQVDVTEMYEQLHQKFSPYMLDKHISTIILDGELLPWKALGEGLIEKEYKVIDTAVGLELDFLQENGFAEALKELIDKYDSTAFETERQHLGKKELAKLYGDATYQSYKWISHVKDTQIALEEQKKAWQTYHEQLQLYGESGELTYKPFTILKMIYQDGTEEIPAWPTSQLFGFVSSDEYLLLDLTEDHYLEKATDYFTKLTTKQRMEGVVIKPEKLHAGIAPFIKVRNPDYLTLIYGYDYQFPYRYQKLINQKQTRKKLQTSIAEFELGQQMLHVTNAEISLENEAYKQVVANLLFEEKKEKELDPRL